MKSGSRFLFLVAAQVLAQPKVEPWGRYEIELSGGTAGNPFTDVSFSSLFENEGNEFTVKGFCDGEGQCRVRFMPQAIGTRAYFTRSNRTKLDGHRGYFRMRKLIG